MQSNSRAAYQGESILAEGHTLGHDTWATGLNNNQLVLGPSGSGKTRNFLKPNLMQANASYLVLDTKGRLFREVGPYLAAKGYRVENIDFTEVRGTVGYDPLDHVRRNPVTGRPNERDIISVACSICPVENTREPFWDYAAANYLASYLAYVLEAFPPEMQRFDKVLEVFEAFCDDETCERGFAELERLRPGSYAASLYRRTKKTQGADKMHSSIMGIIAEKLMCLGFGEALALYRAPRKVDFELMGYERVALFVSVSDVDYSLLPLTSLFVSQALQALIREADRSEGGMLPVPVRLFLDDFSNLRIPDFDKTISVIRSREIWCTILCQSVSQLQGLYGGSGAQTVMSNCDVQLVLAFQDNATTAEYAPVAGRTVDTLRATPQGESWLFVRGRKAERVRKYDPAAHREPAECPADKPLCPVPAAGL